MKLPTIKLKLNNFLIDFNPTLNELRKLDKLPNNGYHKFVNGLRKMRQSAIETISRLNKNTWIKMINDKNITANDKNVLMKNLHITVDESIETINQFINEMNKNARQMNKPLNNDNIVTEITAFLQSVMLKQRILAKDFMELSDSINAGINLYYVNFESVINEIEKY